MGSGLGLRLAFRLPAITIYNVPRAMLKTSIVLHVTLIRIFEMDHYLYGFDHIYCIGCKFEVQCPPVKKGGAVKASLQ